MRPRRIGTGHDRHSQAFEFGQPTYVHHAYHDRRAGQNAVSCPDGGVLRARRAAYPSRRRRRTSPQTGSRRTAPTRISAMTRSRTAAALAMSISPAIRKTDPSRRADHSSASGGRTGLGTSLTLLQAHRLSKLHSRALLSAGSITAVCIETAGRYGAGRLGTGTDCGDAPEVGNLEAHCPTSLGGCHVSPDECG